MLAIAELLVHLPNSPGAEMIGAEVSHDRVLPVLCVVVFIFSLLYYDENV